MYLALGQGAYSPRGQSFDVNRNVLSLHHIFSAETTGPIEAKFHMESPWDWGMKVCSNGPGHMTKMAAMPIYGKKP